MDQGPKAEGLVWPCPLGGGSYRRLLHPCALLHGQEGDSRKPSLSPQEHEPVSTWASTFPMFISSTVYNSQDMEAT